MSRGPDAADLALRRYTAAYLSLAALEGPLLKAVDELGRAEAALEDADVGRVIPRFSRELQAVIQVRRGDAFWDRAAPDPAPTSANSR